MSGEQHDVVPGYRLCVHPAAVREWRHQPARWWKVRVQGRWRLRRARAYGTFVIWCPGCPAVACFTDAGMSMEMLLPPTVMPERMKWTRTSW
jgi:hypothetical protein